MGWERKKAIIAELSPAPNIAGWIVSGMLTLVSAVLIFILHASGSVKPLSELNIWYISLGLPLSWCMIFCFRYWFRERELDNHHFLQQEAEHAQQQWALWAQRSISVLGSCVLLPDGITASVLLDAPPDAIPSRGGMTRRLESIQSPLKSCLMGLQCALRVLPPEISLRVNILTDGNSVHFRTELSEVWGDVFPNQVAPVDIVVSELISMEHLEERLRLPDLTVDLIIIMQLHGEAEYSDGLAALLLTSDDVADKYQLYHSARLLRPMPLDMPNFEQDITLFLETQTAACGSSRVIEDLLDWEKITAPLTTAGQKFGALWQPTQKLNIERVIGKPGQAAPWLLIALAADMVSLRKESLLTLLSDGTECYISTLTTGREYEKTG